MAVKKKRRAKPLLIIMFFSGTCFATKLPRFLSGIKKIFLFGNAFTILTALEDVTQTSLLHLSSAVELM